MLGAKKSRVPGRSQNEHGTAARVEAPDLGADQGLRLVGGGKPTTMRQASSRVLENPAMLV